MGTKDYSGNSKEFRQSNKDTWASEYFLKCASILTSTHLIFISTYEAFDPDEEPYGGIIDGLTIHLKPWVVRKFVKECILLQLKRISKGSM